MIYFLQCVNGGPIKIGFTENLDARRKQLEAHYGRPLAVLATTEGGPDEERAWHDRFSHLRLGRTEQFRPASELLEAIGRPLLVDACPSAVEAVAPVRQDVRLAATREWADWIERAARHCRTDIAKLIDAAVVDYVKERGFDEPPPERIP